MPIQRLLKQYDGNSKLHKLLSLISGPHVPQHAIANKAFEGVGFALASVLAVMLPFPHMMAAQETQAAKSEGAILRGTVHDRGGKLVGNAQVVLLGESLRAPRETSTDTAGSFTFANVSMGIFTLSANSGMLRSSTVSLTVSTPGEQSPVSLVLGASDEERSASAPKSAGEAMEFADKPDFAIASVTDWTAAGGHGSDASLRTSEALTRDALKLEQKDSQATVAGLPETANGATESESVLRAAVERAPKDFVANHRLGLLYLQTERFQESVRYLQAAFETAPGNYDNECDLARALDMAGDAAQARGHVERLLARRETGDLHRMEGELDEKLDDPLSAVHEFQQAAAENPTESNYLAWGSELLVHRAVWQAKEVFDQAVKLYPQSTRMLTARGAALFAGALYDEAALDLCRASDLNPENADPYLFMGKIEIAAPNPLPCVVEKLARFERLKPTNALANYYYAMALWKQQDQARNQENMDRVQDLLTRAVTLDAKCAEADLELGNLSAEKKQWGAAIGYYLNAIRADPKLNEAHYRLGIAYERDGQKEKATEQFQLHDTIAREEAAEIQRQREAVKQFQVVPPNQMGAGKQQAR